MLPLDLPACDIKTTCRQGRTLVYDFLRRRYVALTPEEWVRQHFVHFLVEHKHYPAALLANEVTLRVGASARRCDSVLYARDGGRPRLIAEYKAPHVALTQAVFDQVAAYNLVLRADYIVVSNGLRHYCCRMDYENRRHAFLSDIPDYAGL